MANGEEKEVGFSLDGNFGFSEGTFEDSEVEEELAEEEEVLVEEDIEVAEEEDEEVQSLHHLDDGIEIVDELSEEKEDDEEEEVKAEPRFKPDPPQTDVKFDLMLKNKPHDIRKYLGRGSRY